MNTIDDYRDQINNYIDNLRKQKEFEHLEISIKGFVTDSTKDKISIESNAYIGIRNSLTVDTMILNYLTDLFKDYNGEEKYLFRVKYTDLSKKKNKNKSNDKNIDNEVVEHFLVEQPKHKLSSMVLSEDKWNELNKAIASVKNSPKVYKEWGFEEIDPASKTILCFYGVPGTGKTKCAHGIAEKLNKQILCASYADIQSQYVGVGPKNLRNIFKQAEENDAVLFFDEADSFLRKRSSDSSSSASMHYNSMTNEMMKHLENFNGLVIFATNLTENIDEAFMTRITAAIEFVVPDTAGRADLIKKHIPSKCPLAKPFGDDDYLNLSNKCEGFVGRDIRNAIKNILSNAAENGLMELSIKEFEEGFEQYKDSKNSLNESVKGKKGNTSIKEQIEWNTANYSVLGICTYMAWYDGDETESEANKLKQIAKLLNRDKLIITKLSDLPSLDELAEKIRIKKQKIETACHAASVLSVTENEDGNIDMLTKLCSLLNLENEEAEIIEKYYQIEKERQTLFAKLESIQEKKMDDAK
ncbi:MAG: ATP-binding protein [Bacteroidales bacterium]|nr:ATP-binding protein [Bacteroidales bacterium]